MNINFIQDEENLFHCGYEKNFLLPKASTKLSDKKHNTLTRNGNHMNIIKVPNFTEH